MSLESLTSKQRHASGRAGTGLSSSNLANVTLGRNSVSPFGLNQFNVLQIVNPSDAQDANLNHGPAELFRKKNPIALCSKRIDNPGKNKIQSSRLVLMNGIYVNANATGGRSSGLISGKMYNRVDAYPYTLVNKLVRGLGGSNKKSPGSVHTKQSGLDAY